MLLHYSPRGARAVKLLISLCASAHQKKVYDIDYLFIMHLLNLFSRKLFIFCHVLNFPNNLLNTNYVTFYHIPCYLFSFSSKCFLISFRQNFTMTGQAFSLVPSRLDARSRLRSSILLSSIAHKFHQQKKNSYLQLELRHIYQKCILFPDSLFSSHS